MHENYRLVKHERFGRVPRMRNPLFQPLRESRGGGDGVRPLLAYPISPADYHPWRRHGNDEIRAAAASTVRFLETRTRGTQSSRITSGATTSRLFSGWMDPRCQGMHTVRAGVPPEINGSSARWCTCYT